MDPNPAHYNLKKRKNGSDYIIAVKIKKEEDGSVSIIAVTKSNKGKERGSSGNGNFSS